MATELSLQIRKASLAHGILSDRSIAWNHVTGSNLFVVLGGKNTQREDGELTMRIVQGNRVLESVEIGAYVDHTVQVRHRAEQSGVRLQWDDLPIFAVTKTSLLALRYRLQDKPRRVQLNMQTQAECQEVVSILRRRGVDIFDPSVPHARPETRRSIASVTETRQSSLHVMSRNGSHTQELPYPNVAKRNLNPTFSVGGLEQPVLPPKPTTAKEIVQARFASDDSLLVPLLTRNEIATSGCAEATRPTTSQMYRSHTMQSQPTQFDTSRSTTIAADANAGLLHSRHQMVDTNDVGTIAQEHDNSKPESNTLCISNTASIQVENSNRQRSRPSSSALDLPPLPRPNLVKAPLSSSTLGASSSPNSFLTAAPTMTAPLKRSLNADHNLPEYHHQASSVSSLTQPLHEQAFSKEVIHRPKLMDELLRRRQPLTETSHNGKGSRLNSLADAPHETLSPPPATRAKAPVSTTSVCDLPAALSVQERLETYASQSVDDRHAALEEFMVANIENPAFIKLCEDVENYWRRIALHL